MKKKSFSERTKEDEAFQKEMRDLLTTLKIESEKNVKAKKEFDEWRDAVIKYEEEEIKKIQLKAREDAKKQMQQFLFNKRAGYPALYFFFLLSLFF